MLTEIEKLLETKTTGKKSHVFFTQWQMARDYVPQVLNTISQVFPHYSLHDRTHSETIIYIIGRIVGLKTLEKMSSIDLWMILCAAFYHDVGMAVYSNEKIDFFQDEKFIEFLKTIQSTGASPLHDYSKCFEIKDNKVYYKNDILSAQNYDAARFLIAEFVRKKHGERANDSMHSDMSINLPGSPIPKRIIDVLGNICSAHTQSFDKVMELPFCEAGIDHEDCHPRYIACLLRLGDLLDIDNNRFSEVLLQTLPSIPIDSIWHKDKHMSIKHLQINETKIEARAECDNYDVADITNRWFSMIDSEMYNQMKNWNDIVPDASYGFLPTLGKLDVVLKDFDTINGKERPSFKIDSTRAIELLQGAGLYNEPHQCIRELLQNSVDATLLRVFVESEQNGVAIKNKKEFCERCQNNPIKVSIRKEKVDQDNIDWTIKISDCGIGMSKSDLLYLTTTGGSNKNVEKKKIIERMPEWMRPSGTFGIGFQSVFLLTDIVKMETRKWNKEDALKVTLYNPAGGKEGAVLIQTSDGDQKPFGTSLEFEIIRKSIPDRWSVSSEQTLTNHIISSYDFINDESLDLDVAKIIDEIRQFAYASYIPIYIIIDDNDEILLNKNGEKVFDYFLEEKGIELSVSTSGPYFLLNKGNEIYFRNQIVSQARFSMNYLSFQINILSGDAKEILTLNRDNIQSDYSSKLRNTIMEAAYEVLGKHYFEFDEELKKHASMFIEYYFTDEQKKSMFGGTLPTEWKGLTVGGKASGKTLEDVLKYSAILLDNNYLDYRLGVELVFKEIDDNTLEVSYSNYDEILEFITYKTDNHKLTYYTKGDGRECLELTIGDSEVVIADWKAWFKHYLSHSNYSRCLMPCVGEYKALRIKEGINTLGYGDFTFELIRQKYPQMICPYVRVLKEGYHHPQNLKVSISDKLYKFVYDNRFDESVTMEQIKEAYQRFIDDTKQYVESYLEKT